MNIESELNAVSTMFQIAMYEVRELLQDYTFNV